MTTILTQRYSREQAAYIRRAAAHAKQPLTRFIRAAAMAAAEAQRARGWRAKPAPLYQDGRTRRRAAS